MISICGILYYLIYQMTNLLPWINASLTVTLSWLVTIVYVHLLHKHLLSQIIIYELVYQVIRFLFYYYMYVIFSNPSILQPKSKLNYPPFKLSVVMYWFYDDVCLFFFFCTYVHRTWMEDIEGVLESRNTRECPSLGR